MQIKLFVTHRNNHKNTKSRPPYFFFLRSNISWDFAPAEINFEFQKKRSNKASKTQSKKKETELEWQRKKSYSNNECDRSSLQWVGAWILACLHNTLQKTGAGEKRANVDRRTDWMASSASWCSTSQTLLKRFDTDDYRASALTMKTNTTTIWLLSH